MPCAGDCKQCWKLIELTGEVGRELPEGGNPPLDYAAQPMIVNLVDVIGQNVRGRQKEAAGRGSCG